MLLWFYSVIAIRDGYAKTREKQQQQPAAIISGTWAKFKNQKLLSKFLISGVCNFWFLGIWIFRPGPSPGMSRFNGKIIYRDLVIVKRWYNPSGVVVFRQIAGAKRSQHGTGVARRARWSAAKRDPAHLLTISTKVLPQFLGVYLPWSSPGDLHGF